MHKKHISEKKRKFKQMGNAMTEIQTYRGIKCMYCKSAYSTDDDLINMYGTIVSRCKACPRGFAGKRRGHVQYVT